MNKPTYLTSVDENKELTPPQSGEETEYYENEKNISSGESSPVGTHFNGKFPTMYGIIEIDAF